MDWYEKLKKWVNEGNRSVRIDIKPGEKDSIWVFDYSIMDGKLIQPGENIDLNSLVEAKEKKELERLKTKYEEVLNNDTL